jgi:hypothetical protein
MTHVDEALGEALHLLRRRAAGLDERHFAGGQPDRLCHIAKPRIARLHDRSLIGRKAAAHAKWRRDLRVAFRRVVGRRGGCHERVEPTLDRKNRPWAGPPRHGWAKGARRRQRVSPYGEARARPRQV